MSCDRVSNSGRNLRFSIAGQAMTVMFNFMVRRMFIGILGAEYTGFSGLCAHILNFLSLIEPGFDAACMYCLYKPLAYGDKSTVAAIMAYIRKVYRICGVVTAISGLVLMPLIFLFSSKELGLYESAAVYLIMLSEMTLTCFVAHRGILAPADQKSYITALFGYATFAVSRTVQLFVLGGTQSYILYLIAGMICALGGETLLYIKVGRMYPYIKNTKETLSADLKRTVRSKAFALFFRKASSVLCGSVDNMAVFIFLGLSDGAVYSNYTMLSGTSLAFISVICGSVGASVGNLGVTSGKERMRRIYLTSFFAVFVISSVFALSLFFTYPMIVTLWLGKEMVLDTLTTALFCINMFVSALRRPTAVFIDALGLFEKERTKAVIEAIVMTVCTLAFTPIFGIKGVLLGQLCSSAIFSLPREAYILFRNGFGTDMKKYISDISKYLFAFSLSCIMSFFLCACMPCDRASAVYILIRMAVCAFCVLSVFCILFFDSERLCDAAKYGKRLIGKGEKTQGA